MRLSPFAFLTLILIVASALESLAAPVARRARTSPTAKVRKATLPADAARPTPKPYVDPNIPPPPPVYAAPPRIIQSYGLHAGANLANLAISPKNDTSMHTGLIIGASAELQVHPMFFIEGDLLYIQKGGSINTEYQLRPKETSISLEYIELPVLVKWKFDFESFKLFTLAGPAFSVLLSHSSNISIPGHDDVDAKIGIGGTDLGIAVGGGFEVPLNEKLGVIFNARYELGLTNIGSGGSGTYKNRGVQFMLGSLFQY